MPFSDDSPSLRHTCLSAIFRYLKMADNSGGGGSYHYGELKYEKCRLGLKYEKCRLGLKYEKCKIEL